MQLVLLLLVIMWVGAGVYYFKGRPEGHSSDSIGSFRHQLRVLERTGPSAIDPANSLRAHATAAPLAPARPGTTTSLQAARRRQTLKRRRDVFFGLCLATAGSMVLGAIPGLRVMWMLGLVLLVALLGYVGLLLHLRNQAAERSMKVRYLPHPASHEPALLLRRSAN